MCNPPDFVAFQVPHIKKPSNPRRSVIPILSTQSPLHSVVKEAILKWRNAQAVQLLGKGSLRRVGADILMSKDVAERIIACWTCNKITELSHLRRETTWPVEWIQTCGQSLIDLLASFSPLEKRVEIIEPTLYLPTVIPPSSSLPVGLASYGTVLPAIEPASSCPTVSFAPSFADVTSPEPLPTPMQSTSPK